MAMMGQFSNTTALLTLFATAAIGVGVVKYIAEYHYDKELQFKVIRTAFWLVFGASAIVAILTILFSGILSVKSFKTQEYQSVYLLWGSFLIITTVSGLFNSVLNGLRLIKYFTIINIAGTLVGLGIMIILAHYFGVFGVLITANFTSLILFSIHLYFLHKYRWFRYADFLKGIDFKILKLLSGFILMAMVSGILVPAIQLVIRDKIINDFSFEQAGYWQSVTRISDYYLGFITSVLGIYYLPKLSEVNDKKELRKEILSGYKVIMPVVAVMSLTIWLCRNLIIRILLTGDFAASEILYGPQFLGDLFKIASWLLAYLMLAKGLKRIYIISEIVTSLVYVGISILFINHYGVIGAMYSFCTIYLLYFIAMFILMRAKRII